MTDRPIIFSVPMILALLEGRKTQTRRLAWRDSDGGILTMMPINSPHHERSVISGHPTPWQRVQPGDRLWVRHAFDLCPVYFKPIPGWEDLYAAGTDGIIYRMDDNEPRPLNGTPTSKGYLSVSLSRDGDWETHAVHKLVCRTFYGEAPEPNLEVRHMDGEQLNNLPGNLDWGSSVDNWSDRRALGRGIHGDHHSAKLDAVAAAAIRASSDSQRALAKQYGVSQSTIGEIRTGKTWREDAVPPKRNLPAWKPWTPAIHMPRWASRLTLTVTATRIERLQEISEEDAKAEGVEALYGEAFDSTSAPANRRRFELLWRHLHGAGAWEANPGVVLLTFTVARVNIDRLAA